MRNIYKKKIAELISYSNFVAKSNKSVLTYHSINDKKNDLTSDIYQISPIKFQEHIDGLINKSIQFKNLKNLFDDKPGILITFDDGYKSICKLGIDYLIKNKISALLFVCPKFIELDHNDYINKDDLKKLLDSGFVEIGSHSFDHVRLTECNDEKLEYQLNQSKFWLEKNLSIKIESISYPFGDTDERVENYALKAGYKYGFTTKFNSLEKTKNNLRIPRLDIWSHDDFNIVYSKIKGQWNWMSFFT